MKLIFATNNKNKLIEVQQILGGRFEISTPKDNGIMEEIPEEQPTIEGNATQKSRYIYDRTSLNCFSDDTGLEIEALNNEPGVYSARYAGEHCSFEDNIQKVLLGLDGVENRKACFRTVISLIIDGVEHQFEGRINGEILTERVGVDGFGYDPIFRPDGYKESFAEMSLEQKNKISHRALATIKLVEFLSNLK